MWTDGARIAHGYRVLQGQYSEARPSDQMDVVLLPDGSVLEWLRALGYVEEASSSEKD